MEEPKKLTEEQIKSLKKLQRSFSLRMLLTGFKMIISLYLVSAVVVAANILLAQSETFALLAGASGGFMLFHVFKAGLKAEHDRFKEEIKKILQN